jgi:hypothetical protein
MNRYLVIVVLGSGVASANPRYGKPLDEFTSDRARAELERQAAAEGMSKAEADLLYKSTVFTTSNDTGCPGVDVDIVNASDHTVWNVEMEIEQEKLSQKHKDVFHVPYLTKQSKVRTSVACINDYTTSYSRGPGISVGYFAKGSHTLAEALPAMLATKVDYKYDGLNVTIAPASEENLLEAALAMYDGEVANELVIGIAKSGVGLKELGAAVAAEPHGTIAAAAAEALDKVPPAVQAGIVRSLLSSEAAERWQAKLLPVIDRLCAGARAEVVQLWMQAQRDADIPLDALRDRVRAKCKLAPGDGPAILAALDKDLSRTGAVLDGVDQPLFDGAVAAWKKQPRSPVLLAYLRGGQDGKRFDQAVTALPANAVADALVEVAKTPNGAAAQHKAEWIHANLEKTGDVPGAVHALTQAMVKGEITADPMRELERTSRALAPEVAERVMAEAANSTSRVYDATKLTGIDPGEYLGFANASLENCLEGVDALRACAKAIPTFKGGALVKAGEAAVKPAFVTRVREIASNLHDNGALAGLATDLRGAGLPTQVVAEVACRELEDRTRYSSSGASDRDLEGVAAVDPDAPCIAAARDQVAARKRKDILLWVFAIAGIVLPIPAGGWLMRRRFRKLQKDLPPAPVDEAAKGDKLADRLGDRLSRGLRAGFGDAERELGGTAAGQALAGVDDAVLETTVTTVRRAVQSGDAATMLVKKASGAIYIIALPVRHPRPQIVQRYLGAPWPEHVAAVQAAAGTPLLAIVVACGPEAGEASLLVGHIAPSASSDPEALLDAREARDRGANRFRHVIALATTPTTNEAA